MCISYEKKYIITCLIHHSSWVIFKLLLLWLIFFFFLHIWIDLSAPWDVKYFIRIFISILLWRIWFWCTIAVQLCLFETVPYGLWDSYLNIMQRKQLHPFFFHLPQKVLFWDKLLCSITSGCRWWATLTHT